MAYVPVHFGDDDTVVGALAALPPPQRGSLVLYLIGQGRERVIQRAVERGLLPAAMPLDPIDNRLLHFVAGQGAAASLLRFLVVERDVDPNVPNADGANALHCAMRNGHERAALIIIQEARVCDVDARDMSMHEMTPLIIATSRNMLKTIKALLAKGADVHARDDKDWTALMWAIAGKQEVIAVCLLEAGAAWNGQHIGGITLLEHAAQVNCPRAVKALVRRMRAVVPEPEHLVVATSMMMAAQLAEESGSAAALQALVEEGVDLEVLARINQQYVDPFDAHDDNREARAEPQAMARTDEEAAAAAARAEQEAAARTEAEREAAARRARNERRRQEQKRAKARRWAAAEGGGGHVEADGSGANEEEDEDDDAMLEAALASLGMETGCGKEREQAAAVEEEAGAEAAPTPAPAPPPERPPPLVEFLEAHAHDSMLCTISFQLMEDPVLLAGDGFTYSRAIEQHFASRRSRGLALTSPTTNIELHPSEAALFPNKALRGLVLEYKEAKTREWEAAEQRWREWAKSVEAVEGTWAGAL